MTNALTDDELKWLAEVDAAFKRVGERLTHFRWEPAPFPNWRHTDWITEVLSQSDPFVDRGTR
jgi:hypothetical protein